MIVQRLCHERMNSLGYSLRDPGFTPQSICVRGVNWLGDAVMTLPALSLLRNRFPAARITLVAPDKLVGLWHGQPIVDHVAGFSPKASLWTTARMLRSVRFDLALILPNSPRSAIECWLAGIPIRVGRQSALRSFFLTHPVSVSNASYGMPKHSRRTVQRLIYRGPQAASVTQPNKRHHMFQYLELTSALGCDHLPAAPSLSVPEATCQEVWRKFNLPDRAGGERWLLGVNAGAEYGPSKRWPLEHFIETGIRVFNAAPCDFLIFGGAADRDGAARIQSALRTALGSGVNLWNVSGATSLSELMALMRRCDVFLTNDTGPMHVAAAVGVRVVAVFGSTSSEMTGPGLPGASVHHLIRVPPPCAPCFQRVCPIDSRCLLAVSPELVTRAVISVFGERERSYQTPVSFL